MKIKIEHTLELNNEQIKLIRKYFLEKTRSNLVHITKDYPATTSNITLILQSLEKMGIITKSTQTLNIELTDIGCRVADHLNRDKKLKEILK